MNQVATYRLRDLIVLIILVLAAIIAVVVVILRKQGK